MELLLEIVIYLLVVLGLITVCFTIFNKFNWIDAITYRDTVINEENTYYIRDKKEGEKLVINIKYKNISLEELEKIKESISTGNYDSISDIADEINYLDMNKKNKNSKKK